MKIQFFFSVTTLAVRTSLTQIRKRVGNKKFAYERWWGDIECRAKLGRLFLPPLVINLKQKS